MISPKYKYLLIVLMMAVPVSGISQVKRIGYPFVKYYSPSEYRAGAQIWKIDISDQGLVYFANTDGVLEFDGMHWRNYRLPGDIVVRSVKTTADGRIYAGGFNEIGYFSTHMDREVMYYSLLEKIPEPYRNFGEVWKIYELPFGIVFQSYQQIMIYNGTDVRVVDAPGEFFFSFIVNGELYVNDLVEGFYRLTYDRLVRVPGLDLLRGEMIWAMLPLGENILIATSQMGIYEYDGIQLETWENEASHLLMQSQVYCGLDIGRNTYAFGTIQDGLVICDAEGKIIQHLNLDRGLQNNTVLSMQLDQYGNLWLGLDNGINYVEINSPLTYFTHFNSLSAGYTAIMHDSLLYMGTNRGLFYHDWNKLLSNNGIQDFQIIPGTQGQVWDLKVIDGTLFCGHNNGIFIIEKDSARRISDVQGGWTFIQPDGRDDIIICGTYTSLVNIRKTNGRWLPGAPVKGFSESSRFLAKAGSGKLWMSHVYIGVFRIHFNENYDSVTRVELYNSNNGFPSDKNINVFEIAGKAVFTTGESFYRYDARTNGFIPDKEMQSTFPAPDIQEVYEDGSGNVWYFTSNEAGVFRRQEDGRYFNVDVPFRELSGRFIKRFQFVFPMDGNNVFLGLQDGFVHYTPDFPKNYKTPFRSFIREVNLPGTDSVILQGSSGQWEIAGEIPFKYKQLQFSFSANDFENPDEVLYSTFLEGFDTDWTSWQQRSIREFTNLNHGKHIFHVKARNIFGTESSICSVAFEIAPPWYLKWWAYVLYFLLATSMVMILATYVRYRMEKSKKEEEKRQKERFREREKQLQTEALEAEKEVIRLRNEKLNADMKQKDKELANNTMQIIHKSKSLISVKKELAKLSRDIKDEMLREQITYLIRRINREIDTENQWEVFEKHFESVHEEFLQILKSKFPALTPRELKLCAYLRLNISSKEIATLMNISIRGVEISRYRLRKKLNLEHDENLTSFIMSI